jgi:hypothetical protein
MPSYDAPEMSQPHLSEHQACQQVWDLVVQYSGRDFSNPQWNVGQVYRDSSRHYQDFHARVMRVMLDAGFHQ